MAEHIPVQYFKYWEDAVTPEPPKNLSVGTDLYNPFDCVVPGNGQQLINTGLGIIIQPGYYGRIAPKSGLAHNHSIDVGAGVIDPGYTGPIMVLLFNFSKMDVSITKHSQIAQIIYEKIALPIYEQIFEIPTTPRGPFGLGSRNVVQEYSHPTPAIAEETSVTFTTN